MGRGVGLAGQRRAGTVCRCRLLSRHRSAEGVAVIKVSDRSRWRSAPCNKVKVTPPKSKAGLTDFGRFYAPTYEYANAIRQR